MKRIVIALVVILAGCAAGESTETATPYVFPVELVPVGAPSSSHPGEVNYSLYCAHCHGYEGEGQKAETVENTLSLGMHTVPPHDATGHTWQHPDALLIKVIQDGIDNPLDHYTMPGFGTVLSEAEIIDMIDYMRQWWTEEQREQQAQITQNWNERNAD